MTRTLFWDTSETTTAELSDILPQAVPPIITTYLVIDFLLEKMATKTTSMGFSEKLRVQLCGYHNTPPARLIRILVVQYTINHFIVLAFQPDLLVKFWSSGIRPRFWYVTYGCRSESFICI